MTAQRITAWAACRATASLAVSGSVCRPACWLLPRGGRRGRKTAAAAESRRHLGRRAVGRRAGRWPSPLPLPFAGRAGLRHMSHESADSVDVKACNALLQGSAPCLEVHRDAAVLAGVHGLDVLHLVVPAPPGRGGPQTGLAEKRGRGEVGGTAVQPRICPAAPPSCACAGPRTARSCPASASHDGGDSQPPGHTGGRREISGGRREGGDRGPQGRSRRVRGSGVSRGEEGRGRRVLRGLWPPYSKFWSPERSTRPPHLMLMNTSYRLLQGRAGG